MDDDDAWFALLMVGWAVIWFVAGFIVGKVL